MSNSVDSPRGIGGWLILVAIGLVVTPIQVAFSSATTFGSIFTTGAWEILTSPQSEAYHVLWASLIVFEIIGNLGVIAFAVITLILLLRKSRRTPRFAIIFFAWGATFTAIDLFAPNLIPIVAAHDDPKAAAELIRTLLVAAIWIPYFVVSKRVKSTFIH